MTEEPGRMTRTATKFSDESRNDIAIIFGFVALAAIIVFNEWWHRGSLVYFWDQTYPLAPSRNLVSLLHIWHAEYEFGRPDVTAVSFLPYFSLVWALSAITGSASFAQMVLYFSVLSLSLVGAYRLMIVLLARWSRPTERLTWRPAAVTCAVLYTFNSYALFYEWRIVNTTIFLQALLPWWLLIVLKWPSAEGFRKKGILLLATFGVFTGMSPGLSNPTFLVIIGVVTLVVMMMTWRIRAIGRLGALAGAAVAGCAFWLWPLLNNVGSVASFGSWGGVSSALVSNSKNLSVTNVIRLLGESPITETYNGEPDFTWAHLYSASHGETLFTLLSCVGILIVAIAVVRRGLWRDPAIQVLGTGVLLCVYMAKGSHPPLAGVFIVLFNHLPVFQAFRDPFAKFGFAVATLIALTVGYAIAGLGSPAATTTFEVRRLRARIPMLSTVAVMALAVIASLVLAWPMLTGAVFRPSGPIRPAAHVTIPSEEVQLADVLRAKNGADQVVLSFPEQTWPLMSESWPSGYVGLDPLRLMTSQPIISTLSLSDPEDGLVHELYGLYGSGRIQAVSATMAAS